MADLEKEMSLYEREIARLKRQQDVIEKAKAKWQKKVESKDWFEILNKGGDDEPVRKTRKLLRRTE